MKPLKCRRLRRTDMSWFKVLCDGAQAKWPRIPRYEAMQALEPDDVATFDRLSSWLSVVALHDERPVAVILYAPNHPNKDEVYVAGWVESPAFPENVRTAGALSTMLYVLPELAPKGISRCVGHAPVTLPYIAAALESLGSVFAWDVTDMDAAGQPLVWRVSAPTDETVRRAIEARIAEL